MIGSYILDTIVISKLQVCNVYIRISIAGQWQLQVSVLDVVEPSSLRNIATITPFILREIAIASHLCIVWPTNQIHPRMLCMQQEIVGLHLDSEAVDDVWP